MLFRSKNDEYESDGSEGSETEGEDDEEPKLKYQRLGDSVKVILERDSATCMTVHEKFLVCYPARTLLSINMLIDFN